jgi:hypothetical protein
MPVLQVYADDPDRNVRWAAIALLAEGDLRTQATLDLFINALGDEDPEVRLKAIGALAHWGSMAHPAIPELVLRLQDPENQVAHFADLALWEIDAAAAVAASGWQPFTSQEFGFSVMFPGKPERKDLAGAAIAHAFQAWHQAGTYQGPTQYLVIVAEHPESVVKGSTEEERFRAMKDSAPFFLRGGKTVEEKHVTLGDLRGREYLFDFEGKGLIRSRKFWVRNKLYSVDVVFKPEFVNSRAAAYFLDSFKIVEKAVKPAKSESDPPP